MSKMYVGNLPFSAGEEELKEAFGAFGPVTEVSLVMDRETGRSRAPPDGERKKHGRQNSILGT